MNPDEDDVVISYRNTRTGTRAVGEIKEYLRNLQVLRDQMAIRHRKETDALDGFIVAEGRALREACTHEGPKRVQEWYECKDVWCGDCGVYLETLSRKGSI